MKNQSLKMSIDEIIKDPRNVIIDTGTISGNSIEIKYRDVSSVDSFCYYDRVEDRDSDVKELLELLTEKDKQNK